MKIIIYFFISCVMLLNNSGNAHAPNNVTDQQAIQMLKEFYTVYNTTWSTVKGPLLIKKLDSLQKRYCTKKMQYNARKIGFEQDPFVGDSYTDVEHLKTLTVTKDPAKANGYIVSYIAHTLSGDNKPIDIKVVLHINVVKENGAVKIASVQ